MATTTVTPLWGRQGRTTPLGATGVGVAIGQSEVSDLTRTGDLTPVAVGSAVGVLVETAGGVRVVTPAALSAAAADAQKPTNTDSFTALTAQEPSTLVTSSALTYTAADATAAWAAAVASGGTGVEMSFDGGYTWQASGAVAVGGTIRLRAVSPTYNGTDTVTLNVGGRSYTWSIT